MTKSKKRSLWILVFVLFTGFLYYCGQNIIDDSAQIKELNRFSDAIRNYFSAQNMDKFFLSRLFLPAIVGFLFWDVFLFSSIIGAAALTILVLKIYDVYSEGRLPLYLFILLATFLIFSPPFVRLFSIHPYETTHFLIFTCAFYLLKKYSYLNRSFDYLFFSLFIALYFVFTVGPPNAWLAFIPAVIAVNYYKNQPIGKLLVIAAVPSVTIFLFYCIDNWAMNRGFAFFTNQLNVPMSTPSEINEASQVTIEMIYKKFVFVLPYVLLWVPLFYSKRYVEYFTFAIIPLLLLFINAHNGMSDLEGYQLTFLLMMSALVLTKPFTWDYENSRYWHLTVFTLFLCSFLVSFYV